MLQRPASNLQPLSSEDSRVVYLHLWKAIESIPKHRHNSRGNPDECGSCAALTEMIKAFKVFKKFGQ